MIYIIDNGEDCSGHQIHFVESNLSAGDMRAIVGWVEYNEDACIVSVAERLTWYEGGARSFAGYCQMARPVLAGRVYTGAEARSLTSCPSEERQPPSPEVWRRAVAEIDAAKGWAKSWGRVFRMPKQYPAQARAAVLAAVAALEA
jgi:hypothetical protein